LTNTSDESSLLTVTIQGRSAFEPLPEASDTDPEASLAKAHRPETFETQDEMAGSNTTSDTQINLADQTSQATRIRETPVYQQQYNRRGHPENLASRELSRQSRRAMNDVLATVGICTGRNSFDYNPTVSERSKSSIDSAKLDDIGAENGIGLILDSVEQTLLSTVSVTIVGLRHRLQVSTIFYQLPR